MTPEQKVKMPWGWYEVAARKKGPRMIEDFTVLGFEALGPQGRRIETSADLAAPNGMTRVSFGLVVGKFTRGPRKGHAKWAPGCRVTVDVDKGADKTEMLAFEAESGLCGVCVDGVETAGWDHIKGSLTRPCKRCGASGKAPSSTEVEGAR